MSSGGHGVLWLVVRSLYSALATVTGEVGLSPLNLLELAGGLLLVAMFAQLWSGLRGRSSWSLYDTPTPGETEG